MIDFEHVTKIYKRSDKPALEDIDFHVADGEFVFLVGHSGAGKSTLLKLILREELPTEGRVHRGRQGCRPAAPGQSALSSAARWASSFRTSASSRP